MRLPAELESKWPWARLPSCADTQPAAAAHWLNTAFCSSSRALLSKEVPGCTAAAKDTTRHTKAHLATEWAEVLAVLADLDLLNLLAQTRAIPRAVLADDAHLLGALRLQHRQRGVSLFVSRSGVQGSEVASMPS